MIKDTQKLYELIADCNVRRLTTNEALDYIKKNGIKLSERTYRRYKKELEDKLQERTLTEGEVVYKFEALQRLDTVKKIEHEYWNLYTNTENESLKAKLLHYIQEAQDVVDAYYANIQHKARLIRNEIERQEKERQREEYGRFTEEELKESLC